MTNQNSKLYKTSGYITIDGIKLHYIIEGDGIPCLVIGNPSTFFPPTFSKELKKRFRFIFINHKIYAPSSEIEVDKITIDTIVDDLEKIRITFGLDKMGILGHSAQGLIALEYARKYREHIKHVIMIATFPNYNKDIREKIGEFWESDASKERKQLFERNLKQISEEELNKATPLQAFLLEYLAKSGPMGWYNPIYDCSWLFESYQINIDAFNHFYYVLCEEYDFTQYFHEIKIPVFLALGRYDYAAPYTLWDNLIENFPNLTYKLFEKSGHWPMLEEQALFDKKIIEWIINT